MLFRSQIPISTDGKTNALNVKFKAPIFLYHNTMYAFVIHPIDSNPDTYFWTAKLGQTDLNDKGPYNNRRNTGTFFQTNNNINWDIISDVDLTCKFYRANFVVNTEGEAILGNKPVEQLILSSRRRHTRYIGDWSSDVCSSDLDPVICLKVSIAQQACYQE